MDEQRQHILLTGVTGFIGGSLLPRLLQAGHAVRVLVRSPDKLQGRDWLDQVEVAQGDVFEPQTIEEAMRGIDVAYYFVHSLYAGTDFHELDMTAARNFAQAAERAGVKRIIYLGGLGRSDDELSPHLHSRQETGRALRETSVPVTEFRAAIIIGSGSGSLEMIRYMTERVPLMICPRWVFSKIQPISIDNVLDYLVAALEVSESAGEVIEIGGADVLTYADTMLGYAQARGLWRVVIPVPVLTPSLSSHWVGWVTPVSARLARPLIEGLRNDVVVTDGQARRLFPEIDLTAYQPAVERALQDLTPDHFDLAWIDAQADCTADSPQPVRLSREGMFIERRYCVVDVPPELAYDIFTGLGGERGWLYANWAWRLRGFFNRLLGGFRYQRRRRDPQELQPGDVVGFLRVEEIEPGRRVRLGDGGIRLGQFWLQFEAQPLGPERTRVVQTSFFAPRGLLGLIYWAIFRPLHDRVFAGLIRELEVECQSCRNLSFDA